LWCKSESIIRPAFSGFSDVTVKTYIEEFLTTFSGFYQTVFSFLTTYSLQQLFLQLTAHNNFFHSHSPTKQTLNPPITIDVAQQPEPERGISAEKRKTPAPFIHHHTTYIGMTMDTYYSCGCFWYKNL
jgi:hypothetical protein